MEGRNAIVRDKVTKLETGFLKAFFFFAIILKKWPLTFYLS
jgi:hypothetical protein